MGRRPRREIATRGLLSEAIHVQREAHPLPQHGNIDSGEVNRRLEQVAFGRHHDEQTAAAGVVLRGEFILVRLRPWLDAPPYRCLLSEYTDQLVPQKVADCLEKRCITTAKQCVIEEMAALPDVNNDKDPMHVFDVHRDEHAVDSTNVQAIPDPPRQHAVEVVAADPLVQPPEEENVRNEGPRRIIQRLLTTIGRSERLGFAHVISAVVNESDERVHNRVIGHLTPSSREKSNTVRVMLALFRS